MSTYEISKSSLLSLKAEILRKQQECTKIKVDNEVKIKTLKKNTPLEVKNKEKLADNAPLTDAEEELLKKSRSVLEAKSKLYEELLNSKNLTDEQKEIKKRYLVRFNSKVPDLPPDEPDDVDKYPDSDDNGNYDDYDDPKNPEDEWVEYVDCLGRTRTCLRKDLEHIKANDAELKQSQDKRREHDEEPQKVVPKEEKEKTKEKQLNDEESELLSADMRREQLRKQWEKEEDELRDKTNIHYQDILFNEARTHGVGYYGFSKDEEERAAQQEALNKLRQETEAQQKKSQEMKALREKQLKARILAAKNRKRARMGLPPEEETEETPKETEKDPEKKIEDPAEIEKQKQLEEARKKHIRPWDIGKAALKEHYVHSQEEWVDKKRRERPEEFAPPSSYRKNFRSTVEDNLPRDVDRSLKFSTKRSSKDDVNPYKRSSYEEIPQDKLIEPTPIIDECVETPLHNKTKRIQSDYSSDSDSDDSKRKGAEIAPPPTYDYYGPSSTKKSKTSKSKENIELSIEEGLKFLRKQVEKKETGKHDNDMFIF